jgi:hypothetical protein
MPDRVLTVRCGNDFSFTAASEDRVLEALKRAKPGCYIVEERRMTGELLPSGYSLQRWGMVIRHQNGTIEIKPVRHRRDEARQSTCRQG